MKFFYAVVLLCAVSAVQAADLRAISFYKFAGDKRSQKVENVKSTANPDGTTTVVALLTYADGQQENCTFVMVAKPAEEDGAQGLNVTPRSRTCTSATESN